MYSKVYLPSFVFGQHCLGKYPAAPTFVEENQSLLC